MLFSKKSLALIIIPLLIEQTLAIMLGMADSMMVGGMGETAVSGISLVDTINVLLSCLFTAFASGGAVVVSQLLGKKDYDGAKEASKQLVWLVFLVACALTALAVCLRISLLHLIFGSIEPEIMEHAKIYFLFTALSYPFMGLYNACSSIFRAMGNSRVSMLISVTMNALNIAGNALLIFVFHWGVAGAAIATLFARIVGAVIMLFLVRGKRNLIFVEKLFRYKPKLAYIKRICSIGIPSGVEGCMFQFGHVIMQSLLSGFGTIQIAANAVSSSLASLLYIPGNAIGLTIVVVVGRCIGSGEIRQAKKYTRSLLGLTYVSIWLVSAILCIFSKPIIGLYNLSPESSSLARQILFAIAIFVCTIWPLGFTTQNIFISASDVKFPMILSVFSMWAFRVGLSFVFGKYLEMGVSGVWLATFCDWTFRAVLFSIRYFKGTWLKKHVNEKS